MVLNGPSLGLIVVALFGALWAMVGASAFSLRQRIGLIAAAIAISLFLIAQLHRVRSSGYFHSNVYMYSVLFEAVAIIFSVVLLRRFADRSFIPPVIAIVVGLHFIGLRLATGEDVFVWLAIAMCVFGSVAIVAPRALRLPIAGFGCAFALWASAIRMLVA